MFRPFPLSVMQASGALALACALSFGPAPALAADKADAEVERPQILTDLVACKAIADPAERLACYDQRVASLDTATRNRDVIVADRETMKEARRGLFGLKLPSVRLFGGGESEAVTEIEGVIKSASQNGFGKWEFVLEDGARWVQTDTKAIPRYPRPGFKIVIREAAMGSYLAKVDGQIAVRVKRVN